MKPRNLEGKKITVMGLGLHGGGAAMVKWLVKHGACVTVTDLKDREALLPTISWLGSAIQSRVTWVLGKHRAVDFKTADFIVQNPGVSRSSQYLAIARQAGVPIVNEASVFFQFCPGEIIGVTGTRGKSTTAALIAHLLSRGLPNRRVWLAGLPRRPMMSFIDRVKQSDLVVLELSSWQLEILGRYHRSPHVAVLTNIYPDHLNTYRSMADYINSKSQIYRWQTATDVVVFNADNNETRAMARRAPGQVMMFSKNRAVPRGISVHQGYVVFRDTGRRERLISTRQLALPGDHNLSNILAALTVAGNYGVHPEKIRDGLANFKSLPGRLEIIRSVNGMRYVNDTTATTPDATIAALNVFKKNVILIAGGASKNIPAAKYRELASVIVKTCRAVVLFNGTGSTPIHRALVKKNFSVLVGDVASVVDAVVIARSLGRRGDTIILSPAAASFGMFVNEFDRGDQFSTVVKKI